MSDDMHLTDIIFHQGTPEQFLSHVQMVLETIDQRKLDKAYQDACKEDIEAEKMLVKATEAKDSCRGTDENPPVVKTWKRLLQPKHTQVRTLSPPSRQSACNIPPYSWKKQVTPGKDRRGADRLLPIYQHLWRSTHQKASQVMELLHGVCPVTPAERIPL